MLDEFRPNKAGGYSKYVGPALTYQVFSSNVPGIPVWSMAMTLLVKGAILGKSSFSEPVMPAFFARSIAMVNSDLADAIAVVPWKGGSQQLEDSAIDAADAVIVYGSSQTTKLIAGKVAGSKPCLGYGAKVGLAFIGREALRPDTYADTVHRVAVDIATYDQQSCLAPQTVFVETDGALTPREVAQLLGGELENQQRKYPRSVLSDAENVAIQRARTDAEMRALMGGKAAVFASGHSTAWSVLYRELDGSGADEDVASLMSPLNRTVNVVAVPDLLDAARRLTSCRGWLQSCGVAVDSTRLFGLADTLAEVGVNRICPLGEMDRAKSGWHHDGASTSSICCARWMSNAAATRTAIRSIWIWNRPVLLRAAEAGSRAKGKGNDRAKRYGTASNGESGWQNSDHHRFRQGHRSGCGEMPGIARSRCRHQLRT